MSKKDTIQLFVPQVVLEEVFNKIHERLRDALTKIVKEHIIIRKLTSTEIQIGFSEAQIEKEVEDYKIYLTKVFMDHKVSILDYPNVPHKSIVKKAIKKTKPFTASEKGYRDALIWENVMSLIPELGSTLANQSVIFITNNTNDFCEGGQDLHRDLIAEIEDNDLDSEAIKIVTNLNEFAAEQAKMFLDNASSFKQKIEEGDIENLDLEVIVLIALKEEIEGSSISEHSSLPYSGLDGSCRFIEKVENIAINEVRKLNATEYLINLTCKAEMTIDFFIDKYDHYSSDETSYSIEEPDWNSHVMWASELVDPDLDITLVIDSEFAVSSFQINDDY